MQTYSSNSEWFEFRLNSKLKQTAKHVYSFVSERSQSPSTPHMQTTHTKAFAPKTKWSDEEVKTFFALYPRFGADFKQYVPHLDRTYSQIKGFYHNYLRRHGTEQKRERPTRRPSRSRPESTTSPGPRRTRNPSSVKKPLCCQTRSWTSCST
ncbi:Conserved_hypothetical protein [Hexamita inflata]|uniref:SANT domain-containing protein n=1 Tax=Hexamita inflata TaxID=28002 RepID=A0AA86P0K9_9EUKA|nr:Conserved hypothetical protein [Hexamita inflata]